MKPPSLSFFAFPLFASCQSALRPHHPLIANPGIRRIPAFIVAIGLSFWTGGTLLASTETWSGGANNANWTDNGNWEGAGGAGANDDLIFPGAVSHLTNNNDFAINTSFNSLNIKRGDYVINGNQIFLANGLTANFTQGGSVNGTF